MVGKGHSSSVTTEKKIVVGLKVQESQTESLFKSGSENKSLTQGEEDTAEPFVADVSVVMVTLNITACIKIC